MRLSRSKGFTLLELMIAVTIVSTLAAVAIPAFMKYMNRARSAEAPILVSRLLESEILFFNREFTDKNLGTISNKCFLQLGSVPAGAPTQAQAPFTTNARTQALGFSTSNPVFFRYGTQPEAPTTEDGFDEFGDPLYAQATINQWSDGTCIPGICTPNSNCPNPTSGAEMHVIAIGDVDGDGRYSYYYRRLAATPDLRPYAHSLAVVGEAE